MKLGEFISYSPYLQIPEYTVDENVLVFINSKNKNGNFFTYGGKQGKFTIKMSEGIKTVERNMKINELQIFDSSIQTNDIKKTFIYNDLIEKINQ